MDCVLVNVQESFGWTLNNLIWNLIELFFLKDWELSCGIFPTKGKLNSTSTLGKLNQLDFFILKQLLIKLLSLVIYPYCLGFSLGSLTLLSGLNWVYANLQVRYSPTRPSN